MPKLSNAKKKNQDTGFSAITIVNHSGELIDSVAANQSAFIQLEFQNATQRRLQAGFTILNQLDIPLISSSGNDSNVKVEPGKHSFRVRLPIELFSAGHYRIEGAVWDAHDTYHQDDNLCEFEVIATSAHEAAGNSYRSQIVLRDLWNPNF
jgi:hypothetical protein